MERLTTLIAIILATISFTYWELIKEDNNDDEPWFL
jgi:hypothetical protein